MVPRPSFSQDILKIFIFSCILWCSFTTATLCFGTQKETQGFPLPPAIKKNVHFWEKIYADYSLKEAVIHDSEDLSKIYQVIPIVDPNFPGARRLNTIAEHQAKEKYAAILNKLAKQPPVTAEEKRVAALFPGNNSRQKIARAARNVRSQSGQKERFRAGVVTSGTYMKEIKRILRSYKLPEDLAYLAHVESSFNTRAYSKLGAAGIWQFTPATGKRYLTINYTLDERLDPIRASHAAAKYLQNSYRTLNDWPLTITSYNYGLSGTMRAAGELKHYEKIFQHYNKGYFKFASKNFYSEFLAALKVAKNLEKNGSVKLARELSCHYLDLPGYVHIDNIAKHFGISTATIGELNPALLPPVMTGEKLIPKGYSLRLPDDKNVSQQIASFSPAVFKTEQKSSRFHKVKKGETVYSIARLHGVSVKSLMQANNLDKYAKIFIKQDLRIPGKATTAGGSDPAGGKKKTVLKSTPPTAPAAADSPPDLLTTGEPAPARPDRESVPKKDPGACNIFNSSTKDGRNYGSITVQPEETIKLLAEWLGTTEAETTTPTPLRYDQQLVVPIVQAI
jgi:membrane-bound lytic murein transglycosylase D